MKRQFLLIIISLFVSHFISYGQGSTYSGTYKISAPIIWNGINGQTISGLDIENAPGNSIELTNCSNITIQNCRIANSKGIGIKLYGCSNITITNCSMESVSSGVNACTCTGIKFEYNEVKNVLGPMPRGQMIQFDTVSGGGNSISYNIGENIQGQSAPEDEISLYKSNGLPNDPIVIAGNWIRGGGPSNSGGGIMTGDGGGSYVLVKDNILVNPGQYGIAISSGNNITVMNNKVFSAQLAFSNVGIYAFNQYPSSCSSNTISNNSINFTYKTGIINNTYTDGTCGTLTGWATNIYDKNLNASVLPQTIIGRTKSITTGLITPIMYNTKKINLFPNPAKNQVFLESESGLTDGKAFIYNSNGQKIIEVALNNNTTQIDISNLIVGDYKVKVTSSNQTIDNMKLIIQK
jgi:parallel beta-helix repeat protein